MAKNRKFDFENNMLESFGKGTKIARMSFENTFPEAITLGAWTLSGPFPAGKISPKREVLNSEMK